MDIELDDTARIRAAREVAFKPFSWLSMAVITLLGVYIYIDYGSLQGVITLAAVAICLANLLFFNYQKNITVASIILSLVTGSLLMYIFYGHLTPTIGTFWLIIYPIPTILLLGRVLGSVFVTGYTLAYVPGLFIDSDFSNTSILMTMLATNVVTLLVFVYERIINHYTGLSEDHSERLSRTTKHLQDEILQREQMEYKMRIVLDDLANKNQKLDEMTRIDEATISSIGEAVLQVNQHGVINRANPSSGRVLGINQQELTNRKLSKILEFTTMDDEKIKEPDFLINKSIAHRSIVEDTYKVKRPEGSTFYAQMTASPLVVGGTVFGAVVVVRDVTQEVNVDQAKTEFVSIASHQLRTPLSTINWYLEMVLAGDFGAINDEQKEFISEAYEAGKRMGHLIDSLLNVSRIDVGVFAIDPKPTDISHVIDEVITDLQSNITKKNIKLKVDIDTAIGQPSLDPRLMSIVFQNLLSNAVKYTNENGQVTVLAKLRGKNIYIEVRDNGYGIPAHQQDKIFSKMFRAENAVEKEPDGTGLGLYIIKSIIEEVGGTIRFNSKENEGTTFFVTIPKEGMKSRKGSRELTEGAGV